MSKDAAQTDRANGARVNTYRAWHARTWHGMTTPTWLRLLAENKFAVAPHRWGLATTVTGVSLVNTLLASVQEVALNSRIRRTELAGDPIFIVGHWRSGTTYLHQLLVLDDRFAYPSTYECMAPSHALMTGGWLPGLLGFLLPNRRPMDDVQLGWEEPQEDEFALCNLGVESPYTAIAFPARLSKDGADLSLTDPATRRRWQEMLHWFLQSITARQAKPIVLKSPPHTARIDAIREIYPQAKFVHILRDPFEVYCSTMKLWPALQETQGLQRPAARGDERLRAYVLATFERMYDGFAEQRSRIPDDCYAEVRYDELVAAPETTIEGLYDQLSLGDFREVKEKLARFVGSLNDYQPNRHQLSDADRVEVGKRWLPLMRPFGFLTDSLDDPHAVAEGRGIASVAQS